MVAATGVILLGMPAAVVVAVVAVGGGLMGDLTSGELLPPIDGDGDGDGGALSLLCSDRYRSRYAPASCFPTSQWPDRSIVCRHDRRCWSSASAILVCWPPDDDGVDDDDDSVDDDDDDRDDE